MKTLPRRQKSITLKEYLVNTSLKKRLASRSNSKQRKQSPMDQTNKLTDSQNIESVNRDKLLDEIRLAFVDAIKDDMKLTKILRMFNRIVELFTREISQKHHQKSLLETMIHENPFPRKASAKDGGESSRKRLTTEPIRYLAQNDYNFDLENERARKNSIEIFQYRKGSNASSEEIPNINVLLMTRHDHLPEKSRDLETEETLLDASHSGDPNKNDESRVSIDFGQSRDCQLNQFSLMNSNINDNWLKKSSIPKKEDLRASSTNWKNSSQGNVLNRFEEFKKRIVK